jgi:sulfofructose kinase
MSFSVSPEPRAQSQEPPLFDVVGLGENSVDLVYRVPTLPVAGTGRSKVPIASHAVQYGGQIATAIATCASLGLRTTYLGAFGDDDRGALIRQALAQRGVDLSAASVRPVPNRYAVILVDDRTGDRLVLHHRDAALRATLPPGSLRARWLHVDAEQGELALQAAARAVSEGMQVSCDVDDASDLARELVQRATVPILAEHVPEALTGERDAERALQKLARPGHVALCVTQGTRGALMLHEGRLFHAPAFAVQAVDTTGAGDVFRGALIYAMLREDEPREVLSFANAAAAVSVTRAGALDGVPSLDEVNRLLALGSRL